MIQYIRTYHLQSHDEMVEIWLPKTGLIRFSGSGRNSDGKSVITKTLTEIVYKRLHILDRRKALIRRGYDFGTIEFVRYDGIKLFVCIHVEASKTFIQYTAPGLPPLRRYLADKGLETLVSGFGFHYLSDWDFSLNIYNTFDPLFMVTTPNRLNYDAVASIMTDSKAEGAIENFDELIKEAEAKKKEAVTAIALRKVQVDNMILWDVNDEEARKKRLEYLYEGIEALSTPTLPDFDVYSTEVEIIKMLSVDTLKDSILSFTEPESLPRNEVLAVECLAGMSEEIIDLTYSVLAWNNSKRELRTAKKQVCPTCGRRFKDHA